MYFIPMSQSTSTHINGSKYARLWVRCGTQAACLVSSYLATHTKKRLHVGSAGTGLWEISIQLEKKQLTKRFLSRLQDLFRRLEPHLGEMAFGWHSNPGETRRSGGEKRFFREFQVTERIVVSPVGARRPSHNGSTRILELEPGRNFPCGLEPGSQSMLLLTEWLLQQERIHRALDVKTGCGLLALAGLVLGAEEALALDTDPEAIRITRWNARRNGLKERLKAKCLDVKRIGGRFQLVMAMASHKFIIGRSRYLSSLVSPSGWLLLGGFWHSWTQRILSEFQDQFQLIQRRKALWWEAVLLRRRI